MDGTLTALAPAAAIDVLVRRRIEQTHRQLTELTLAWDVLTELTEEHRSGRPSRWWSTSPRGWPSPVAYVRCWPPIPASSRT
ncbi:hypothetical protein ACFQ0B_45105 [Nonomuraea thailandensis]